MWLTFETGAKNFIKTTHIRKSELSNWIAVALLVHNFLFENIVRAQLIERREVAYTVWSLRWIPNSFWSNFFSENCEWLTKYNVSNGTSYIIWYSNQSKSMTYAFGYANRAIGLIVLDNGNLVFAIDCVRVSGFSYLSSMPLNPKWIGK